MLRGYRVCLGDIAQNIAKMGVFCSFPEGSPGLYWLKSNKFQTFQFILPILNSQFLSRNSEIFQKF